MWQRVCIIAVVVAATATSSLRAQEDINDQLERMCKEAARKVAASVVQIETRGGSDLVVAGPKGQLFRKPFGPTTGVVVDSNGYIITSAFNFLNNPTTIVVRIPGKAGEELVAQRVATDKLRMLTLLKVDAKGLQMPAFVPKKEMREGQWAIALGRALDTKMDKAPAFSVGIISAVGRVWGRAVQTDAKISPVNYGGPIIDIQGRIQGILIPASPGGDDETAGFEWYDSGIGFAIPMEDVLAVLPRLKQGKDLSKGLLGIGMKSQDDYGVAPEIANVAKGSPAAKAGLKSGDVIVEIEGKPVVRMAQVKHVLGTRYEGDKIALKYKRGATITEVKSIELAGTTQVVAQPFLGILPLRDDPKLGVEVRYIFDKSPAEKAGLKVGDRIVKYGPDEKQFILFDGNKRGRAQFLEWLNTQVPGTEIKIEVKRKEGGKTEVLTALLDYLPGALPGAPAKVLEKLPETPASAKKALEPLELLNGKQPKIAEKNAKKPDTGLLERNTPDGEHKYWIYVDEDYDENIAHSVVVWLHPPGKNKKEDMEAFSELWEDFCKDNRIILVMPVLDNDAGWVPNAADFVVAATRDTMNLYTIDRQRVVAHGMGIGGQMALHLGFHHRDLFTGVASVGATVTQIKPNVANQRLSFYLAAGELDPIVKSISEARVRLAESRYPAFYRELPERGREYLTPKQLQEVIRWIDTLDRQ